LLRYCSICSVDGSCPLFFFFKTLRALFIIFFETFYGAFGKFVFTKLFSSFVVGSLPFTFIKLYLYISKMFLNSSKDGIGDYSFNFKLSKYSSSSFDVGFRPPFCFFNSSTALFTIS